MRVRTSYLGNPFRFSNLGLPIHSKRIAGRKVDINTRLVGPRHDPYVVQNYVVEVKWLVEAQTPWPETTKYEYVMDSLAESISLKIDGETEVEIPLTDDWEQIDLLFAQLTGIKPSKFEKTYYRVNPSFDGPDIVGWRY